MVLSTQEGSDVAKESPVRLFNVTTTGSVGLLLRFQLQNIRLCIVLHCLAAARVSIGLLSVYRVTYAMRLVFIMRSGCFLYSKCLYLNVSLSSKKKGRCSRMVNQWKLKLPHSSQRISKTSNQSPRFVRLENRRGIGGICIVLASVRPSLLISEG